MPKLRHIALATNDPEATARFYKEAFGFKEVARQKDSGKPDQLAHGVYLSDGTLNIAILKFHSDQLGKGMDYVGLHHFGVLIDDNEKWVEHLESIGADCFMRRPPGAEGFFETKFRGPDGVVFDISDHPWAGSLPEDAEEKAKVEA